MPALSSLARIGHFRILKKLKDRVAAEKTSLQFALYKQRKMHVRCALKLRDIQFKIRDTQFKI